MRAIIVTHPTPKDVKKIVNLSDQDYVIAVDQAVKDLMDQNMRIDLAVGDFDSLENLDLLDHLDTVKLDPIKDITDTFQALHEAKKRGYKELVLVGGFGGDRIEHFIAHLMNFRPFESLVMLDEHSRIYIKKEGTYTLTHRGYISFFAYPEATISLKGFKYPLNAYLLTTFDPLGISNELIDASGDLIVHHGVVLIVESNKK